MSQIFQKRIYWLIFFLYIILLVIIGFHHEQWADEALAWIIARDYSFSHIFIENTKYEGHPFVWYFILKIILSTHIAPPEKMYNWIFIISIAFSGLGIYLFLFKSKFPMIIKCLFPFTFYIFYQHGIIPRNHTLVFPLLAIIACFYLKRLKHPYIYCVLLALLFNISAFTFPIAAVLIIFWIIDIYKNKETYSIKKYIIPIFILLVVGILTAIHMIPPTDSPYCLSIDFSANKFIDHLWRIAHIYIPISEKTKNIPIIIICLVITTIIYTVVMKVYCKNLTQRLLFISINSVLYFVFLALVLKYWHMGYALSVLIFTCWILSEENNITEIPIKKYPVFYLCILYILTYYIVGNIQCCIWDIKNNYSASKEVAQFIRNYNLTQYDINGLGFKTLAINAYFEKNIFYNYPNIANWCSKPSDKEIYLQRSQKHTPIIILSTFDTEEYNDIIDSLKSDYNIYLFKATNIGLNYKSGCYEDDNLYLYIDKNYIENIPNLPELYSQ
ncbi:hypothetical protein IJ182_02280 [bacterium]|nr:hypothetical protein [bacterium]